MSFPANSMNGRFPVLVNGNWREAEFSFATEREVRRIACWRIPKPMRGSAVVVHKIYDAVEFARLACNRWRYYQRCGATVRSLEHLEGTIVKNQKAESAMILIARPAWASRTKTLGIAYLRRTWCHHLYLEFFTAHPQVIAARYEKIGGVGDAMLHQILALADHLDIRCIWGEATEHSCGWYQDHLAIKEVRDHFFIEDDVMEHCQKERLKAQQGMLARRTTT